MIIIIYASYAKRDTHTKYFSLNMNFNTYVILSILTPYLFKTTIDKFC